MQPTLKIKNNNCWGSAVASRRRMIETDGQLYYFTGIWYDGIWYNGVWRANCWLDEINDGHYVTEKSYWLTGKWICGTILDITSNYVSFISPKAYSRPNKTISLNRAKYEIL